jgi:hypothetical protein
VFWGDLSRPPAEKVYLKLLKNRFKTRNIVQTISELMEGFSAIATYSAKDSDLGIGKLSSISPCTCISMAS